MDLNTLTGGAPAGGLIAGAGSTAYIRVFNKDLFPGGVQPTTPSISLITSKSWETWKIDISAPSTATKVETPPLLGGIPIANVDGRTYSSDTDFAAGTSVVLDMSVEPPERGIAVRGAPVAIVRIR